VSLALFILLGFAAGSGLFYLLGSRRLTRLQEIYSELKGKFDEMVQEKSKFHHQLESLNEQTVQLREKNAALNSSNESLKNSKDEAVDTYKTKNIELQSKLEEIRRERDTFAKQIVAFKESEHQRKQGHDEKIQRLNTAYEQVEKERARVLKEKEEAGLQELQRLKETWLRHEENVEGRLKLICQRHNIEYIDKEKFPYKGKPDNAVKVCDEFVIFDSKSPDGENLSNFPSYIKKQAEDSDKYAKYDGVKNDVFLVIPTNAAHTITEKYRDHGHYRVHIITEDALEPILINLKKLENYEFAEKLSPEDREKIVTTIGKMAHGMKRRIQTDYFFANEFISVLSDAENLPETILQEAQKVERSSKLNPPIERRTKLIEKKEIVREAEKLVGKAHGQEINLDVDLTIVETAPLQRSRQAN